MQHISFLQIAPEILYWTQGPFVDFIVLPRNSSLFTQVFVLFVLGVADGLVEYFCKKWLLYRKCGQNKIVVYEVVDRLHVPVDDGFTCAQNQVAGLFWKEMSQRRGINLLVVHNHEILLYIYSYRKLEKIPFMLFPIEFSLLGNGMTPIF